MDIVKCPHCQSEVKYNENDRGKKARCPKCKTVFRLPSNDNDIMQLVEAEEVENTINERMKQAQSEADKAKRKHQATHLLNALLVEYPNSLNANDFGDAENVRDIADVTNTLVKKYGSYLCNTCGSICPTQKVKFEQHIGMVIMSQHKTIFGNLCRNCIDKYYSEFTEKTAFGAWWGVISFFITPFILINNNIQYNMCRHLEYGASQPNKQKKAKERSDTAKYIVGIIGVAFAIFLLIRVFQ